MGPLGTAHLSCRHHGPPLSQLQQLSSSGMFQTTSTTAAVEGLAGEAIHWPVEANIVLPTPRHITQSSLPTSLHIITTPHNFTPSQHVSCSQQHKQPFGTIGDLKNDGGTIRREGEGECEEGKVVYECGKGGVEGDKGERAELVFESRFEGGNLYQARQT